MKYFTHRYIKNNQVISSFPIKMEEKEEKEEKNVFYGHRDEFYYEFDNDTPWLMKGSSVNACETIVFKIHKALIEVVPQLDSSSFIVRLGYDSILFDFNQNQGEALRLAKTFLDNNIKGIEVAEIDGRTLIQIQPKQLEKFITDFLRFSPEGITIVNLPKGHPGRFGSLLRNVFKDLRKGKEHDALLPLNKASTYAYPKRGKNDFTVTTGTIDCSLYPSEGMAYSPDQLLDIFKKKIGVDPQFEINFKKVQEIIDVAIKKRGTFKGTTYNVVKVVNNLTGRFNQKKADRRLSELQVNILMAKLINKFISRERYTPDQGITYPLSAIFETIKPLEAKRKESKSQPERTERFKFKQIEILRQVHSHFFTPDKMNPLVVKINFNDCVQEVLKKQYIENVSKLINLDMSKNDEGKNEVSYSEWLELRNDIIEWEDLLTRLDCNFSGNMSQARGLLQKTNVQSSYQEGKLYFFLLELLNPIIESPKGLNDFIHEKIIACRNTDNPELKDFYRGIIGAVCDKDIKLPTFYESATPYFKNENTSIANFSLMKSCVKGHEYNHGNQVALQLINSIHDNGMLFQTVSECVIDILNEANFASDESSRRYLAGLLSTLISYQYSQFKGTYILPPQYQMAWRMGGMAPFNCALNVINTHLIQEITLSYPEIIPSVNPAFNPNPGVGSSGYSPNLVPVRQSITPIARPAVNPQNQLNTMRLVQIIGERKNRMEDIAVKETPTMRIQPGTEQGGDGYQAYYYALWIQSFLRLNALPPQVQNILTDLSYAFMEITESYGKMLEIKEYYKNSSMQSIDNVDPFDLQRSYHTTINILIDKHIKDLNEKKRTFFVSGYNGHYTIDEIRFVPSGSNGGVVIKHISYNAGDDAMPSNRPLEVWGTTVRYMQNIPNETALRTFIHLCYDMKLRRKGSSYYNKLRAASDFYLGLVIPSESKSVSPQQQGNCTTRSPREMIRSALGDENRSVYCALRIFINGHPIENLQEQLLARVNQTYQQQLKQQGFNQGHPGRQS
ncbi:MAG: hypothetical protein IPP74_08095 [Alphaproteobacteria bacterium]|nr:hypothetical protein [Alphaproteobacteria bacterium]